MVNLLKICVLSLVVSFGAFAENSSPTSNEATMNTDSGLVLDQNTDQFLDFVKDAVSSIVGKITKTATKLLGLDGCKETKAQFPKKSDLPSKEDCAGDKACEDGIKAAKDCY